MKTYHIRFTENDFDDYTVETISENRNKYTWRTSVYDLYDNDQYRNFSVKRAPYGTDLLGNGVYTGLNNYGSSSEVGFVEAGRFIDTSSRIDIIDWSIEFDSSIAVNVSSYLNVYTTEDSTSTPYYLHVTPELVSDWSSKTNILPNNNIYIIDALRYAFFELVFILDAGVDISGKSVELILSIDIDPPTVNSFFPATRRLLDKFPEWMELREFDPSDPFSATPSTPSSVGGQFINAIAGEWLTDLSSKVRYQEFQYHIDTADIAQKDWVYVAQGVDTLIWSITGDGVQLARCADLEEFYNSEDDDNAFLWNRLTNEVYTNVLYEDLVINGIKFYQKPFHIWNSFDDIGVTVDLFRLQSATPNGFLENNESFKNRILDVYKNRGGIHEDGVKLALRRELNLWRYWNSDPDSDFQGATPEILEVEDLENNERYFIDGVPTKEFKKLVDDLSVKYPLTWGFFQFEKAFWDIDGAQFHKGLKEVPRLLDATPTALEYFESGVGDNNDLYVFKPTPINQTIDFNANISIRGRRKQYRTEHVPLAFDIKVYGSGIEEAWDNDLLTGYFTIEVTVIDNSATPASPSQNIYYTLVTARAQSDKDFFHATPTETAAAFIEWTTPDGYTDALFEFRDKQTGELYPGQIDLTMISLIKVYPGHYNGNYSTPSYANAPSSSDYMVWFDDEESSIMGYGGSSSLTKNSYDFEAHSGAFWFKSLVTSSIEPLEDNWTSEPFYYTIMLNGNGPDVSANDFILNLPQINFPSSLISSSIKVEILTFYGSGNYGAFATENSSTPIFIPSDYIQLDNNATWTDGYLKSLSTSTTNITFSTSSGSSYPVEGGYWEPFSATLLTPISGRVSANGPWRYGIEPAEGNTNFILENLSLTRDDFGIPNTSDYILTWIGIESVSDKNVVAWLDFNTVVPAVEDDGEQRLSVSYPDNSVQEELSDGVYSFSSFNLNARLKPSINEKWNPKVHSGWFYQNGEETYLYASPNTMGTSNSSLILEGLNRLGAPIIGKAFDGSTPYFDLRQVCFFDSTPSLISYNTEDILGNGKDYILASYNNIYDIEVLNVDTNASITPLSTSISDNIILLPSTTNSNHTYRITYKVAKSFYIDNEFVDTDGIVKTKVFFDKVPSDYGATSYMIDYETSTFDPATPVDLPLNTLYTPFDEGFIYIDEDVYDLAQVEVSINPSTILADGYDFINIVVKSYDMFGNPKPNQSFNAYTNFGVLSNSQITTDENGYGFLTLTSNRWDPATPSYPSNISLASPSILEDGRGVLYLDGPLQSTVHFGIQGSIDERKRISAVMASDHVMSNSSSATYIYGKVETSDRQPVPYAYVDWRKARTVYELFNVIDKSTTMATPGSFNLSGRVVADAQGRFSIGPFVPHTVPGYWLASVETNSASPSGSFDLIGDVVYWCEYPNITNMLDSVTGMPVSPTQFATPSWTIPGYTEDNAFPSSYDEDYPEPGYESPTIVWSPPEWYAINKYKQYQMGLYGTSYGYAGSTPNYPDYKEL